MKIAVSALGETMDSKVSERFGRCPYFIVVDAETGQHEAVKNAGPGMTGGAGPEAVRAVAGRGAKVVLTGSLGPNAQTALESAGIKGVTGFTEAKTVKEAVEEYLKGPHE